MFFRSSFIFVWLQFCLFFGGSDRTYGTGPYQSRNQNSFNLWFHYFALNSKNQKKYFFGILRNVPLCLSIHMVIVTCRLLHRCIFAYLPISPLSSLMKFTHVMPHTHLHMHKSWQILWQEMFWLRGLCIILWVWAFDTPPEWVVATRNRGNWPVHVWFGIGFNVVVLKVGGVER